MVRRRGRLNRQHHAPINIEFVTGSAPIGGDPAYLELFGLAGPLDEDEPVVVESEDGRVFHCRVLDHTDVCAITETVDKPRTRTASS
jgi:hypothetical protein